MGGNDYGSNSFAAIIVIASLRSLISAAQKKERENNRQRRTKRDKEKNIGNWRPLGNKKKRF